MLKCSWCVGGAPLRLPFASGRARSTPLTLATKRRADSALSEGAEQPPPDEEPKAQQTLEPPARGFKILGLDPSPELFAISLVYFVQGILGLSRLAVSFYFKDELHLDPADLAFFTGFTAAPWLIKPVYGFLSDTVPILGSRRRSYLVLCSIMGSFAWASIWLLQPTAVPAVALLTVASAGGACSDVVVDSIVVEASRGQPLDVSGSYQSLSWGSAAIGGIVSAYFSGYLIEKYSTGFVFGITAAFPLLVVIAALLISEDRVPHRVPPVPLAGAVAGKRDEEDGVAPHESTPRVTAALVAQGKKLWSAIKQPGVLYPTIFVFIWQATPSADSAMFYFYNEQLHFGPEFLGRIRLVASVASLIGIWLYNSYLKAVPLRVMFRWSAIIGTVLSLSQVVLVMGWYRYLGLSDELFCLSDEIVLTVLGRVSFMPILTLAATLSPEGVEATLFATLMSVLNAGGVTGSLIGSVMTKALGVNSQDFSNLALLVTVCALLTLAPLPLLGLVPDHTGGNTKKELSESERQREPGDEL